MTVIGKPRIGPVSARQAALAAAVGLALGACRVPSPPSAEQIARTAPEVAPIARSTMVMVADLEPSSPGPKLPPVAPLPPADPNSTEAQYLRLDAQLTALMANPQRMDSQMSRQLIAEASSFLQRSLPDIALLQQFRPRIAQLVNELKSSLIRAGSAANPTDVRLYLTQARDQLFKIEEDTRSLSPPVTR